MLTRVFIAAILAGLAASLVMTTIQNFRTTPLILQAEVYENANAHEHNTGENTAEHKKSEIDQATKEIESPEWQPEDGFERTAYGVLSDVIVGIGLAFVMLAASMLTNIPITPKNGALWGLVAFAIFTLSPAAGLPPELPAMPVADLQDRQIWWVATVVSGAIGVWLIAKKGGYIATIIALALFIAPHLVGTPQPSTHETAIPAHLIQEFVANSMFMMAVTWIVVGTGLGFSMKSQKLVEE